MANTPIDKLPAEVYDADRQAQLEAMQAESRAHRQMVNAAMAKAREALRADVRSKDYEARLSEKFAELLRAEAKDHEVVQDGNVVRLVKTAPEGKRSGAQRKPHLEPQQHFASTDGDQQVLPDQTIEDFEGIDREQIPLIAPAPHTPDNMVTKYPHQDGFSDADALGLTESSAVQSKHPLDAVEKKKRKKKEPEQQQSEEDVETDKSDSWIKKIGDKLRDKE